MNLVQFEVPRSSTFAYCPDQDEVKSVDRMAWVGGLLALKIKNLLFYKTKKNVFN